jgi:hypothetical protein
MEAFDMGAALLLLDAASSLAVGGATFLGSRSEFTKSSTSARFDALVCEAGPGAGAGVDDVGIPLLLDEEEEAGTGEAGAAAGAGAGAGAGAEAASLLSFCFRISASRFFFSSSAAFFFASSSAMILKTYAGSRTGVEMYARRWSYSRMRLEWRCTGVAASTDAVVMLKRKSRDRRHQHQPPSVSRASTP